MILDLFLSYHSFTQINGSGNNPFKLDNLVSGICKMLLWHYYYMVLFCFSLHICMRAPDLRMATNFISYTTGGFCRCFERPFAWPNVFIFWIPTMICYILVSLHFRIILCTEIDRVPGSRKRHHELNHPVFLVCFKIGNWIEVSLI